MLFTRQLATLINAGLPLLKGLQILVQQEPNDAFKKILLSLIDTIEEGSTFSETLARNPTLFSPFYLSMVHAGELGGMLGVVLHRVATFQEKRQAMKNKATSILLYPAVVLVMSLAMLSFLLTMVIPKFEAVFSNALGDQTLPPLTQWLLEVSRYGRNHFPFILLLLGGLFLFLKIALRLERLRAALDRFLLTIPYIGKLFQKYFIAHFFNILGTLLLHGVPILEAISVTQKISSNRALQAAIKLIDGNLRAGDSFLQALKAARLFPPMTISMVAVGEETGELPEMLLQIATVYEQEVDCYTTQFMALLEPCAILILACLVGIIVIALFLPLLGIMSGVQSP